MLSIVSTKQQGIHYSGGADAEYNSGILCMWNSKRYKAGYVTLILTRWNNYVNYSIILLVNTSLHGLLYYIVNQIPKIIMI